jgi:hypothetical protein
MKSAIVVTLCALLTYTCAFGAPVVGFVEDFEAGTHANWHSGADVNNIPTGGPAGVDDNYLQLMRPYPAEPYSFHMGTHNDSNTWTGNYLAAGITAIEVDVNTFAVTAGPTDLSFRLMIFGPGGQFSTATAKTITTAAGWQHLVFDLSPSELVHVTGSTTPNAPDGPGILSDTLAAIDTILIRHDPAANPTPPGTHPQHISATIGFDNIEAIAGTAPSYDVAWIFDNNGISSYVLDSFEPNYIPLGQLGADDPTMLLELGKRYQVTVINNGSHPFEVIAKAASFNDDTVLLSMATDAGVPLEADPDIAWLDNGLGTVAFTVTDSLLTAMTEPTKIPGYRCGIHSSSMRGNFDVCLTQPQGDIDSDCDTDFYDFAIFAESWMDNNIAP